jgi:hypothetical protein
VFRYSTVELERGPRRRGGGGRKQVIQARSESWLLLRFSGVSRQVSVTEVTGRGTRGPGYVRFRKSNGCCLRPVMGLGIRSFEQLSHRTAAHNSVTTETCFCCVESQFKASHQSSSPSRWNWGNSATCCI